MKIYTYTFVLIIALSFSLFAFSFNKQENITGQVCLVGTSVFPRLIIRQEDGREYFFSENIFNEYKKYAGDVITISAVVKKTTFSLADGSKRFTEFIITKANIIKSK